MEKINEDQDLYLKLFENKINSNLFKFLVREYFSNSMNPFLILKMLSKILFSNISKLLKLKYILFFLTILKRLSINERILKEHINPIIADTFEHILTRKADFVIIVQYAIFLVQIGQLDFALSRLQIFSTDLRFINNGELFFYRGLIDYIDANSKNNKTFLSFFHKSLTLLKKNEKEYGEFILDFLVYKNMLSEVAEFLKHDKIKEIFDKNNKKKFRILNILTDSEFMDLSRKITLISDELNKNFTDFSILIKFCDLVEYFYEDNKLSFKNGANSIYESNRNNYNQCDVDMIKSENNNDVHEGNTDASMSQKIACVGIKHLIVYYKFLSSYILFDPYNEKCLTLFEDVLSFLKSHYLHMVNKGEDLEILKKLIEENNKIFVELLLKQIIIKDVINLHLKNTKNGYSSTSQNNHKNNLNMYHPDLPSSPTNKIEKLLLLIKIIDDSYQLVTGHGLSDSYTHLYTPFYALNFNITRSDLTSWIKSIRNINSESLNK